MLIRDCELQSYHLTKITLWLFCANMTSVIQLIAISMISMIAISDAIDRTAVLLYSVEVPGVIKLIFLD